MGPARGAGELTDEPVDHPREADGHPGGPGGHRRADAAGRRGGVHHQEASGRRWGGAPGRRGADRAAADAVFTKRREETEDAPDDWRAWFRLAVAYQ
ncbi:hypothetical protein ACWEQB_33540, partial [Streptomyces cyaneofuscatus]